MYWTSGRKGAWLQTIGLQVFEYHRRWGFICSSRYISGITGGLIFFLFLPLLLEAQVITTFAGSGLSSYSGEGVQATSAGIPDPIGGTFDKYGNYYFADGYTSNRIRRISVTGIITTIAGTGSSSLGIDGIPATASALNFPNTVKLDTAGNIFIVDGGNHRVRKVDVTTGIVHSIAGTGSGGYSGDGGPATLAKIYNPQDACIDKWGNLYIADYWNNRVRKVDVVGIISTFAGGGMSGVGDNGPATAAQLVSPSCIAIDDSGNVYVGEESSSTLSNRVRKINALGIITTIAGNGTFAYSGDGIPATNACISPAKIIFDTSSQLFIADDVNRRVYKIDHSGILHLVAGTGSTGFIGDGGSATAATIHYPSGVSFDPCGNLYITDVNNRRIRKVTFNPTCNIASLNMEVAKTPKDISIYPNPVNEELQIENALPNTEYKLLNVAGVLQQCGNLQQGSNAISLKQLSPGMYMLVLTDEEGRKIVKKIVKE